MNHKQVYEEQILPLIKQIRQICEREDIPGLMFFQVTEQDMAMTHLPFASGFSPFSTIIMTALGVTDPRELPPDIATLITDEEVN